MTASRDNEDRNQLSRRVGSAAADAAVPDPRADPDPAAVAEISWHARTPAEVAMLLGTQTSSGLASAEAASRLESGGPNELPLERGPGVLSLLLAQFSSFLVLLLVGAAAVSAALHEWVDAGVILAIILLNAVLGVSQEMRAERALEALRKLAAPQATVIRDGAAQRIPARELVLGDLVAVETGDFVPADLRLISCYNLKADESALTGESVPADKEANAVFEEKVALGDRRNTVFSGTIVTCGRGHGIVVATGRHTQLGLIAGMLQAIETEPTPLQKALASLGRALGLATLGISAIVFLTGLLRGGELLEMFMTSVSLAVAAVPEGLPAVVTIVLAMGMQRMVERHAIIRRLPAVEALGSTTVICSDKTGTLTQNQMTVVRLWADGREYTVSGEGYRPTGDFERSDTGHVEVPLDDTMLAWCLRIGVLCNDSRLHRSGESEGEATWRIVGDPTEGSLVVAAQKAGMHREGAEKTYPRIAEVPFDSGRKRMSTLHRASSGGVLACVKGAPDVLLQHCGRMLTEKGEVAMDVDDRERVLSVNRGWAAQALRVLGLAYREFGELPAVVDPDTVETDLTFVGLVAMVDPVRPEAVRAVELCRAAGITPIMVTGDFRDTAIAVGRVLRLGSDLNKVVSGDRLAVMSQAELVEAARTTSIYARVAPEDKVRIVDALKEGSGHIVAMTGDGVNDAMALKRADIGVAMGITGTDVAKETADMILTDDNFASIVAAVEEGRRIFANIRKFVFFLLSCNVGEVIIVFVAMLLGLPLPLRPIHLLWLNLVTDSLPALALGMERTEPGIMSAPPRDPREPIINRPMIRRIAVQALVEAAVTLAAVVWAWRVSGGNLVFTQTMAFATLVTAELVRAFTARSATHSVFRLGLTTNPHVVVATVVSFGMLLALMYVPVLREAFGTTALSGGDWAVAAGLGVVPAVVAELTKLAARGARGGGS